MTIALHGTPLSHFTRKIRILLAELEVPFDFVRVPGVLGESASGYGDNPLLRVPTLVDEGVTLIESDHIARHLVARFDPSDQLRVRTDDVRALNRLAVANGVMDNEVVLILAKRGGLTDLESVTYFRKLSTGIDSGLAWLDANVSEGDFDWADVALVCMSQHLAHYGIARDLDRHSRIATRVAMFADRPSIARTTPAVSLAEASAAGWKAG